MPVSIVPACDAPLRGPALTFLYHRLPRGERERQMAQTLVAVSRQELSLENLLVAIDGDRVVGAVLAVRRPGGAAFLWPPIVQQDESAQPVARALLEAVGRRVDEQEIVFTQCLLDPADEWGQSVLAQGGVPRITDLILLSRPLPGNELVAGAAELIPECYSEESHAEFARIVEHTYTGTLDCPALAQMRSGEQLLEAHRATGQFNPQFCRIYRTSGRDVGILLLAEHPDRDVWEVAYMGVVPEARGRGFGRAILAGGIDLVRSSGRATMEIAVDVANAPALRLYESLSFSEIRRYAVHLRFRQTANSRKQPE